MMSVKVLLLVVALVGCARAQAPGCQTAADVVASNPDLSILLTAAQAADLVGPLSDSSANFTLFAPNNAAFAQLLSAAQASLGIAGLNELDPSVLQGLLAYHVVNATALSTDLVDGQVLTSLQGAPITVRKSDGGVSLEDNAGNTVRVVQADIPACNAVVHIIDGVLLPEALPPAGGGAAAAAPDSAP